MEVLIERLENLKNTIEEQHSENKEAHANIINRLDYTNGKVRSLQIWKATIIGGLAIVGILGGYLITDYLSQHATLIAHEKADALLEQRVSHLEQLLTK